MTLEFASSDTKPKYLPDTPFDIDHVGLDLSVDPEKARFSGRCRLTIRILSPKVREISLDASGLKIRRVSAGPRDGKLVKASFHPDGRKVRVVLPRAFSAPDQVTIELEYSSGTDNSGMHFIRPTKEYPDWPVQAWTQGQTDDARCWFPCRDVPAEKATARVRLSVPEGFVAISNGTLDYEKPEPATKRHLFQWTMAHPHSMYLFSVVVGRFEQFREPCKKGETPVLYYFPPGRLGDAKRAFNKTPKAVAFFNEETGVPYPYEHYTQVAASQFGGGMEHTTVTTQTDLALIDEVAAQDIDFDGLVSHELAHQWFGDLVTCKDWSHAWLNESFATYYEALFQRHDKGVDFFRWYMMSYADSYFAEDRDEYRRPIVTRVWRESFQLFDRHLYPKGACILHFIRSLLGDEAWRASVRHYLEKFRYGAVETTDLIGAFWEKTGFNLEPLLDQWIFRPGHPVFRIHQDWNPRNRKATVWITQMQAKDDPKGLFQLPLEIAFDGKQGRRNFTCDLTAAEQAFEFELPAPPTNLVVDPESRLFLKRVDLAKPLEWWVEQLSDRNVVLRIEAAREIAKWKTPEAAEAILEAIGRESFWAAKMEMVTSLGEMPASVSMQKLMDLRREKNPRIRRVVFLSLGNFRSPELAPVFETAFRKDPSLFVRAQALHALAKTGSQAALPAIGEAMGEASWNELLRARAVDAMAEVTGDPAAFLRFLAPGTPVQVKARAVSTLMLLGKNDPGIRSRVEKLLDDESERVACLAAQVLGEAGHPASLPALKKTLDKSGNSMFRKVLDRAIRRIRLGKTDDPPKPAPRDPKTRGKRLPRKG